MDEQEYLIKYIENFKPGDIITEKDMLILNAAKHRILSLRISEKDNMARIEFPSKYLKKVYEYLISLK
jgi:hypothetical protein